VRKNFQKVVTRRPKCKFEKNPKVKKRISQNAMSVYATPVERSLEWAYINAAVALQDHTEAPSIDRTREPNAKKRKTLQHARGIKTHRLRTEMKAAHTAWRACKHRPTACACGKGFQSHKSRDDPTRLVCHACLIREPTFQNEFKNALLASAQW
tara:strand:- start:374 stop:835 length:462 start_codon:yes stop_codon:yes gene_type:complete